MLQENPVFDVDGNMYLLLRREKYGIVSRDKWEKNIADGTPTQVYYDELSIVCSDIEAIKLAYLKYD